VTRHPRSAVPAFVLALCSGSAGPVAAQAPEVARDTTRASLDIFGGRQPLLGAVLLGSLAAIQIDGFADFDRTIQPAVTDGNALDRRIPRNLGRVEVAAGTAAATVLVGEVFGSQGTARLGTRTLEALLLNSALTSTLKILVGRARPGTGFEEDRFAPISLNANRWSFPSGHTSTAFAWATVLSNDELRDDAPFVPYVVYPLAAWAGASRLLDGKHWFTDVVAGAAVGIFSAQVIDRLHPDPSDSIDASESIEPEMQFQLLIVGGPSPLLGVSLKF